MKTLRDLASETRVLDLGPLPAPRLAPTATVHQALQMMVRARRGAVVVAEGQKPVGIFTERDIVVRPIEELTSREHRSRTLLRSVMSTPPETVRRLCLTWGVHPCLVEPIENTDQLSEMSKREALRTGLAKAGDRVVLTAGVPFNVPGGTNFLKVMEL